MTILKKAISKNKQNSFRNGIMVISSLLLLQVIT